MKLEADTTECGEKGRESGLARPEGHTGSSIPKVPTATKKLPHVLYIIDQLCQMGGAERVLFEMVRRLSKVRFSCSVVAFKLEAGSEAIKNFPVPVHVLPLKRTYDFNAAKMAIRLRRIMRMENVSITHTFFETSDLWAGPVAKLNGCPVLISSRRDMGILRTRKHHLAYPFVNRLFDRVLTVSNEVRSYCIQHDHLSPHRVETLYNGIDMTELDAKASEGDARRELQLASDVPIVSTLANIRYVKGIDVLVRAAQRVCREIPNVTFLVVGSALEADTMASLRTKVESLQLAANFNFVGGLTNPFPVLRASNVFCLPSRNEGFSNALIQAMGCGLPCVATRVGGNAEALEEGQNGYLVASEDADAMADRILRFLRDPALAQRMGETARETVRARFSMDTMMNRLMTIYDELLAAKYV